MPEIIHTMNNHHMYVLAMNQAILPHLKWGYWVERRTEIIHTMNNHHMYVLAMNLAMLHVGAIYWVERQTEIIHTMNNKSTKVLMPRWCWPKLHGLSIAHTAYMTAATHIHASTAQLQLLCTQTEQQGELAVYTEDLEYNKHLNNLGVCQINVYT